MNASINTAAELYKFDNNLFATGIGNLDAEVALKKVSNEANPILWMAGHLTSVRYHLSNLLGDPVKFPWPKTFDKGFDSATAYPEMPEIRDAWLKVADSFPERMTQATDAELETELEYKLPHNDHTVRGALIFFAYHEAWHFGQIAYVRKCLGMEGLVPY